MDAIYTWYIAPQNDVRIDALLVAMLGKQSRTSECWKRACQDGQERELWRCPNSEFTIGFRRKADKRRLPYVFYVAEGTGRPRLADPKEIPAPLLTVLGRTPLKSIEREASYLMGQSI